MNSSEMFYSEIEDGVREIVRALRSAGINTECSCEHERYIQCQTLDLETELRRIWNVMVSELGISNFVIEITARVMDGHWYRSLRINIPEEEPA